MKCVVLLFVVTFCSANADQRIAGGDPVEIAAYSYATSLLTNRGSGSQYTQACGGSILTNNAILSAASCFYTDGTLNDVFWWRARVGSASSTHGGIIHLIRLIGAHPQFSSTSRAHDLAVLRTTLNIALVPDRVAVARLAGRGNVLDAFQPIWAIGWGLTAEGAQPSEQLRQVQFWVVEHQTCVNRYAALGFTVTSDMVCTGWLDVGVLGQCQGDAGSPLVVDGVVVGVHSWVEGCADGWYPGVNTRVGTYASWIVSTALA